MKHGMITEHIAFEIGFNKMISSDQFGLTFDMYCRYRGDHTGFFFMVYIWKYGFEFNIYDIRHEVESDQG